MDRAEDSAHSQNINQQKEGVKKEQVKGCGSVNRPTPGSQCPAEPVASGFLRGVKISKIRGQISGLGVKPWVTAGVGSTNKSQCRAISLWVAAGVTIGVMANFGHFFASQGAGSFAARSTVDKSENYRFFLCL